MCLFFIGLHAPEPEISNVHSEPAMNRKSVNVHFNAEIAQPGALRNLNTTQAHSIDDLRQSKNDSKSATLKIPKIPNIMKKRNSKNYSTSSGSENGYDQNGVLRISAPFLNNPLVQHVN